ncbi:MAG: 50S ribosomal protein L3 [Lentisphaeria bacterium]|jgi:large subunit ribosomal protein L3|nr:50S ribosomal protein L3 [Lentisphaeria bacterium]
MKALIGKKIGMTQVYDEQGTLIPVTVIEAGPCVVTAVKTVERDGYDALQLGFGARKAKNLSRAEKGHLTKAVAVDEAGKLPAVLREFRGMDAAEPGAVLNVGVFAAGDFLDVVGTTKGRGFQGVVKRWNFGGGRASHGGAWERRPGSIGCCEFPGRVAKGKKMAGHYGCDRRTVQNLKVVRVNVEENYLMVKGAVPGANGGILLVRSALKKSAK